ncbi:MAG: PTS sugar transporter subunit IIB [Brevinema sp.]
MHITLACFAGMSTSLFVTRIEETVKEKGMDWTVEALPASSEPSSFASANVILIAPQARYMLDEFKENYPDKKIKLIPMDVYGTMNVEKLITLINED